MTAMGSIRFRLNHSGLRRLTNDPSTVTARHMRRVGNTTSAVAKGLAPTRSGTLRGSIGYTMHARYPVLTTRIHARSRHAMWVHEGTGLYGPKRRLIRPKRAKVLRWTDGGRTFFARSVRGQRPQRFLTRAVKVVVGKTPRRTRGIK